MSHEHEHDASPGSSRKLRVGLATMCAVGALATLGVSSRLWLAGYVPLLGFVFGFFIPTLIITLLLSVGFDPAQDTMANADSAPIRARMRSSLIALLVPGVIGALLCSVWFSGSARAQAALTLHAWGDEGALVRCAEDPDGRVAQICCEGTSPEDRPRAQVSNAARMQLDRGAESACFISSIDGTSPHGSGIARALTNRWEYDLITVDAGASAERLCEQAANLARMDRVPGTNVPLKLAHCALSSPEHAARQCCAGELRALTANGDLSTVLPPPTSLAASDQAGITPTLLEHALPTLDEKRAHVLSTRAASIGLDSANGRAWTVALACELLDARNDRLRDDVVTRLNIGLAATGCGLPDEPLSSTRLIDTCNHWVVEREEHPELDPPLAMCLSARAQLHADVHRGASTRIQRALAYARVATRSGPTPKFNVLDLATRIGPTTAVRTRKVSDAAASFERYQNLLGELRVMKKGLKADTSDPSEAEKVLERVEEITSATP